MITRKQFRMGMTVSELKELIHDWPETDATGEPTEVWIETAANKSSPVTCVSPEVLPLHRFLQDQSFHEREHLTAIWNQLVHAMNGFCKTLSSFASRRFTLSSSSFNRSCSRVGGATGS
jgi:hypothetical protein